MIKIFLGIALIKYTSRRNLANDYRQTKVDPDTKGPSLDGTRGGMGGSMASGAKEKIQSTDHLAVQNDNKND